MRREKRGGEGERERGGGREEEVSPQIHHFLATYDLSEGQKHPINSAIYHYKFSSPICYSMCNSSINHT
jgi:hypothetical protein